MITGQADHGGIIGAKDRRGNKAVQPLPAAAQLHLPAQFTVGRNSAPCHYSPVTGLLCCGNCFFNQHIHHRLLERGADVVNRYGFAFLPTAVDMVDNRSFQAAETEVKAVFVQPGSGKCNSFRVALCSHCTDNRAAGIAEVQEFGHLVECLAGSIIAGTAAEQEVRGAVDRIDRGVAAGNHQGGIGKVRPVLFQHDCQQVSGHMIDTGAGNVIDQGNGLGKGETDQQGADEPGPAGGCYKVDVGKCCAGIIERFIDHRPDGLYMTAGGKFGYNAAIPGMDIKLAADHIGQYVPVIFQHCRRRIIAGTFNGEYEHNYQVVLQSAGLSGISVSFADRLSRSAAFFTLYLFCSAGLYVKKKARSNCEPMSDIKSASPVDGNGLVDMFSRTISYLRLSLTDRCNLKCMYCVTEDEKTGCLSKLSHNELLSYEELLHVVRVAVAMGITKLRLTGGEPLVRNNIMHFIDQLAAIDNLNDIRITTNAVLLEQYAEGLLAAGVRKINISLDTLNPQRFAEITGVDCFDKVWRGIEKARALGFSPVKLNMVVMRGINDDELVDFARMSRRTDLQIRFIEFMPMGASSRWDRNTYMSSDEIKQRIRSVGELIPVSGGRADGPASVFRLGQDAIGKIGFISPISHHFCDQCNRLRLTSEGMLRSCLLHDEETDLRSVLRRGGTDEEIQETLLAAIRNKPKGHQMEERLKEHGSDCHGRMSRIGG